MLISAPVQRAVIRETPELRTQMDGHHAYGILTVTQNILMRSEPWTALTVHSPWQRNRPNTVFLAIERSATRLAGISSMSTLILPSTIWNNVSSV